MAYTVSLIKVNWALLTFKRRNWTFINVGLTKVKGQHTQDMYVSFVLETYNFLCIDLASINIHALIE